MIPREERPTVQDLESYTQVYDGNDEQDYDGLNGGPNVRDQLAQWLYDYRRRQDEERARKGDKKLLYKEDSTLSRANREGSDFDAIQEAIRASSSKPRY